ncbi:MAG: oxidoreductase [Elusimicrobia bacterium RIFOXYA2_FULL_39_19]|nr:MAG: oxidoreductase [Elusimicrobia bacterium RIFOXYA2_FULL_39_19]
MSQVNPYLPIEATVEKVIDETASIKTFVFRPKQPIAFQTGQFMLVTIAGIGESAFTPSSSPSVKDTMEFTIMKVGVNTEKIHALKPGDTVGLRGPYGKGYPVEKYFNHEVLIVGGGVGLAPLRSLLLTLIEQIEKFKKITLCYGSKTPDDVVYKYLFPKWKEIKGLEIVRSVDKCPENVKWDETVGLVTCLLDKVNADRDNAAVIVCGPPIMMKFATLKIYQQGYNPENTYLSMERNMSCGLGKCGHCGVGPHYCCKDGPVFTYEQLKDEPEIWD